MIRQTFYATSVKEVVRTLRDVGMAAMEIIRQRGCARIIVEPCEAGEAQPIAKPKRPLRTPGALAHAAKVLHEEMRVFDIMRGLYG